MLSPVVETNKVLSGAEASNSLARDRTVDIVVAGAGNGGMSAAIAAAEAGAKVLVVDIDSTVGGSSVMSGGAIHINGATSYDHYVELTRGMHDPELSRAYFDGFVEYTAWLKSVGAAVWGHPAPELKLNMGTDPNGPTQQQCRAYFDSLERIFAGYGGEILLKTRAREILTDRQGNITGLRCERWGTSPLEPGQIFDVSAGNIVLSMGGFQNNKELCARYLGADADLTASVGSPFHRGEGMILAQQVGAALSTSMSGLYGSIMSAHPAKRPMESPEQWVHYSDAEKTKLFELLFFTFPPGNIVVNVRGDRVIDETEPYYRIIGAIAREPRATGFMLFDEAMFSEIADHHLFSPGTGSSEREKFETRCVLEGSELLKGDTLEALVDTLAESGPFNVYKANLLRTIQSCNEAADRQDHDLSVRRSALGKLANPPFYAWPFTSGIVYTMGGLAIDKSGRVLDCQQRPIAGLYATPPCAGGLFRQYYGGSIASAGTFGMIAGRHASARKT